MGMMRPVLADIQGSGAFDESRAPPNDLYSLYAPSILIRLHL